jgi:hypothetical protein
MIFHANGEIFGINAVVERNLFAKGKCNLPRSFISYACMLKNGRKKIFWVRSPLQSVEINARQRISKNPENLLE